MAITLTREQLYQRVWNTPMTKVAAEFGLSDVAVKKLCRKLDVPTPPRGYWARLAAGQKMKRTPLPKKEAPTIQINPATNAARRAEAERATQEREQMQPLEIPTPLEPNRMHPHARAAHTALTKCKPDASGIVQAETDATPYIQVGAASIGRVCRTLHVIYSKLESRGVTLATVTPYRHRRLGFKRGEDEVCLLIEEPLARIKRAPTPAELKRPSSEWKLETVQPSGQFKMIVLECEQHWTNRVLNRSEGPRRPLPMLVTEIVEGIWNCFVQKDQERERRRLEAEAEAERQRTEAERRRLAAEKRAIEELHRKEEERQQKHRDHLASLAAERVENALRAAEWLRLHRLLLDFATDCERHWTTDASAPLNEEQRGWLAWLRSEANALSPFSHGYPNPSRDGAFDGSGIPVGGPYPPSALLPLPPTMHAPSVDKSESPPEKPAIPEKSSPIPPPSHIPPPSPPFPYWLLHRR